MRDFSLRPLSHRFLVAPRSGFRTTVSPTYQPQKKKQNKTKQKRPAMQPGQGKRGQFGVNNSVVAGVPFHPFLACPNSPFSQPSFQGSLLAQRRPHVD